MDELLRRSKAIDVLLTLNEGRKKVTDIHIAIGRTSLPILQDRLRELEASGYIKQAMLENKFPYRKEFELTEKGRETAEILKYMEELFKYDKLSVGKKWILLVLGRQGEVMATQMQKLLFLLRQEEQANEITPGFYDFVWYKHGPYSAEVVKDVERLEVSGLVEIKREHLDIDPDGRDITRISYTLTERGKDAAEQVADSMPDLSKRALNALKKYGKMDLRDLIKYVYSTYSDQGGGGRDAKH